MILEIKLNWKDYLNAIRLHKRPRPGLIIVGSVLAVVSVPAYVCLVVNIFKKDVTFLSTLPLSLSFACLLSWFFLYLPHKASKVYWQQPSLRAPFTIEVVAEGLNYTSDVANADLTWDYFPKWKENKHLFLLYHSDDLYQIIPKRIFKDSQDQGALRTALSAHIKKIG